MPTRRIWHATSRDLSEKTMMGGNLQAAHCNNAKFMPAWEAATVICKVAALMLQALVSKMNVWVICLNTARLRSWHQAGLCLQDAEGFVSNMCISLRRQRRKSREVQKACSWKFLVITPCHCNDTPCLRTSIRVAHLFIAVTPGRAPIN